MTIKSVLLVLLSAAMLFQCKNETRDDLFVSRVKHLEYQREEDLSKWLDLLKNTSSIEETRRLTLSAAYTRSSSLVPLFGKIFKLSVDDSVKKLAVFGIGNSGSPEAEKMLLSLPFDSLSLETQNTVIKALGQCCSQESFPFFRQVLKNSDLRKTLLNTLAICARRKISTNEFKYSVIDTGLKQNTSVEEAYFLLYAANFADIPLLINKLPGAKGLARIYLLKSLLRKAIADSARLFNFVRTDSLLNIKLRREAHLSVTNKNNWRMQLAAVNLCPYTADSTMIPKFMPLLKSKNLHVQIAAWKVFGQCFPDMLSSELLQYLPQTKNQFYLRTELFKLAAVSNPQSAYRLIMQELSKGDVFYKTGLLEGLCKTKLPQAVRTIRQFLNVSDAQLVNTAFGCLAELKKLRRADYEIMLTSDHSSTAATAVYEAGLSTRLLKNSRLLDLFKKFSRPGGLDVQQAVVSSLKERSFKPDSTQRKFLLQHTSHPIILGEISSEFDIEKTLKSDLAALLPPYLKPDSIKLYSGRPVIEITTNRGIIMAELYTEQAPLTVHNFLRLAQKSFFDNLTFHRVVPDFVIQGGDPFGDGWGGPEYLIPSEDNPIPYKRGSIGMATSGFDTGGSQFFICHSDQPHLTGNYTLFGYVTSGMDIVDKILPGDRILAVKLID